MSTEEGKIKGKVKKVLKHFGAYWHCPVQNGMGAPSLDFICCFYGKYLAIETKAPGKKPTPRQVLTIGEMEKSGGKVFVISDVDGCIALGHWMKEVQDAQSAHSVGQEKTAD